MLDAQLAYSVQRVGDRGGRARIKVQSAKLHIKTEKEVSRLRPPAADSTRDDAGIVADFAGRRLP